MFGENRYKFKQNTEWYTATFCPKV